MDIFNADECVLFYRLVQETTTAVDTLLGRKKEKQKILLCRAQTKTGPKK